MRYILYLTANFAEHSVHKVRSMYGRCNSLGLAYLQTVRRSVVADALRLLASKRQAVVASHPGRALHVLSGHLLKLIYTVAG